MVPSPFRKWFWASVSESEMPQSQSDFRNFLWRQYQDHHPDLLLQEYFRRLYDMRSETSGWLQLDPSDLDAMADSRRVLVKLAEDVDVQVELIDYPITQALANKPISSLRVRVHFLNRMTEDRSLHSDLIEWKKIITDIGDLAEKIQRVQVVCHNEHTRAERRIELIREQVLSLVE